jgi:hypothetical protein
VPQRMAEGGILPLRRLFALCGEVQSFLRQHPSNVVIFAAPSGPNRPAFLASCWAIFAKLVSSASEAVEASVRCLDGSVALSKTQRTYTEYFATASADGAIIRQVRNVIAVRVWWRREVTHVGAIGIIGEVTQRERAHAIVSAKDVSTGASEFNFDGVEVSDDFRFVIMRNDQEILSDLSILSLTPQFYLHAFVHDRRRLFAVPLRRQRRRRRMHCRCAGYEAG